MLQLLHISIQPVSNCLQHYKKNWCQGKILQMRNECQTQKVEVHEKFFKIKKLKIHAEDTKLLPTLTHRYDITGHVARWRGA